MPATQLANQNSIVVAGHVMAFDANGAKLIAYDGAPTAIATKTALAAVTGARDGQEFEVQADGSNWRYVAASALTSDTVSALVITATGMGSGAFLRTDTTVDLKLPIIYTDADATVKWTTPAGFRLRPTVPFWEITAAFTTGASGKAGLSSSNASFNTSGDLLGGASLDAAASLTLGLLGGTVGAKVGAPATVLVPGDTILWNKSSTFTAGTGFAHVPVNVLLAPTS